MIKNSSQESFDAIPQWIQDARDLALPDIKIFVLGNKSDLKESRVVKT